MCLGYYTLSSSLQFVILPARFSYDNQLSLTCLLIKCFLKNACCPRQFLIYHSRIILKSSISFVMQHTAIICSYWLILMELNFS